jgi:hypothetical protein
MTLSAMTMNAQDVYDAIVDGNLAPEFAAVAGAGGGKASNVVDGKSVVTITKGKATVVAVGGTTPANKDGGGQQISAGEAVDEANHLYEAASVEAWNDINWGKGNQGDIDFSYVTGTGNPYVQLLAEEVFTDDVSQGYYRAAYVYYEPDGSKGLPITGLYYKFSATEKGAFKVKVWANKGNRLTFVVKESDMKAQPLYASGYINGVNENGQKKFLTVAQVDSVHHDWIYGTYEAAVAAGDKTEEQLAELKATADQQAEQFKYVIGRGNQPFWGWLTFDVEPGENYWVFQHSSQIGFGGFEYYEGGSAEDLIADIEPDYVYTTNFTTYEDEETGERVTWKGEKIVGDGQFVSTDEEGAVFGDYYQNVAGTAPRQNYLLLPEDVLAHSANTHQLTIGFWVSAEGFTPNQYTYAPFFSAYAKKESPNGSPMMVLQSRGSIQINNNGWCDFGGNLAVGGKVNIYNSNAWEANDAAFNYVNNWLGDEKWHYYTLVITDNNAKVYLDGKVKNEWNYDDTTEGQQLSGFFDNGAALKYVCLGGNQAWDWNDLDSPFRFARLFIKNKTLSANEIAQQMLADFPGYEEYLGGGLEEGIQNATVAAPTSNTLYNLAGQKVDAAFKGLVIKNGHKTIQK